MQVDVVSPRIFQLVREETPLERIASGFTFTEGPIWSHQAGYLLFSDMPEDVRRRWDPRSGVTEVRSPSNKCNGMTYDADGALVVCEHASSSVVREDPSGERSTIASHYRGLQLNSPNDVVVGSDGSAYFTDPSYGRMPVFGVPRDQELGFQGLFRVHSDGELELLADDFEQPNGLCFSPDGDRLYVNDTERAHIRVFEFDQDHAVREVGLFAEGIASSDSDGAPDGMKCDEAGNVLVTGPGGIWVFNAEGDHLGVLRIPEKTANFHWGGDGWRTLFITASTSLYRVRMEVAGSPEPFMQRM